MVAASAPANRLEDIPREAPAGGPPHDGFDPSREVAVRLPVSRTVPDRPASAADPCFAPATALPDLAPRVRPEAPGQPAFDAVRRVVAVPDPSPKSAGVVRLMLDRAG